MREEKGDHPKKAVTTVSCGSQNTDFFHTKFFSSPNCAAFLVRIPTQTTSIIYT